MDFGLRNAYFGMRHERCGAIQSRILAGWAYFPVKFNEGRQMHQEIKTEQTFNWAFWRQTVTDHRDIFEFSSKAAYALDLKNGNEDGATRGGYLNSSLAQGRIMSNVSSDFWRHHSESGSRIQGHFDDSLRCGSFNFYIERDDSLFQNCFWWGWLRHSEMLLTAQ